MSSQRTLSTTVTIPSHWPAFSPGEVLRIKAPGGSPGLWRTYEGFSRINPGSKGPQIFAAEVNLRPAPPSTNKTAPTHTPIVRMGRAA